MLFSDLWFLQFLPLAVLAVWVAPARVRRLTLLTACAFFHAHYAGPAGMAPIIVMAALTYFALSRGNAQRLTVIAVCVLALVHYKYTAMLNSWTGLHLPVQAAPLAVSFFVFEFVHLLSDRARGVFKGTLSPVDFGVFAIFFPSLAAGPIKRIEQFRPELARLGRPSWAVFTQSLARMLIGAFKKFCLADGFAKELLGPEAPHAFHGSATLLSFLLALQIYLDFSGYSDIALGLAGLFNIRLPENFSFPYFATNLSDFWRRWHISLSTWIRDYVYIVLGGNRVSNLRRFANLLIAMVLCGLWHGAAAHYAAWGLLQGCGLLVVHFWRQVSPRRLPPLVGWAMTFVFVQFSWLVFFYNLRDAWLIVHVKGLL